MVSHHVENHSSLEKRLPLRIELAQPVMHVQAFQQKFADGGSTRTFPHIDISRVNKEFGLTYRNLLDDLPGLI